MATPYRRILDKKIWIEEGWTEDGLCDRLVAAGFSETDIILPFQSPDPKVLAEVTAELA